MNKDEHCFHSILKFKDIENHSHNNKYSVHKSSKEKHYHEPFDQWIFALISITFQQCMNKKKEHLQTLSLQKVNSVLLLFRTNKNKFSIQILLERFKDIWRWRKTLRGEYVSP